MFPVLFIAVSITILLLSSVAQAASTQGLSTAQSPPSPQAQEKTLIVGSEQDYPPFATGMTDAEAGGFTVDLWKAVAAESGLHYSIRVHPFREVLESFKEGKVDVLINLARSEERHQFADFTVPHVVVHGAIFVRSGESNIRTEDDLAGKSVIVLNADLAHDYALEKGWGKQLVLVDTTAKGFQLLASGKYDAMLIGKLPGMQTILALGLTDIKVLKVKVGFSQKFGFAVHKGQSDLLEKINEGLAITKANGTYDRLYEKWFGLYEIKEVTLSDVLKYLIPIVLLFLAIGGYFFYRRHAELKAFEHQLNFIANHAPVLLAHYDKEKRYKFVNLPYADFFGREQADLVGRDAREVLGEEYYSIVSPYMDKALSGQDVAYDAPFPVTAGKPGAISVRFSPEYDKSSDSVVGFIAAILDITEQKNAEEMAKKLAKAVEQDGESVMITDMQGVIEYVNASFTRITGYTPEDVLGKNPRVLKSGNQNKEYYERLWSTISKGEVWYGAVVDRRKNGTEYPALMTISPILNDDGQITHYVGTQQDMTEHEMIEEKFRQAQKMEALGTLVGGIAHDFNNMLAGMTGNLYLAKKKAITLPDVVENLDNVEKLSFRAAEMIKQLLAFARKGPVKMIPFGLTSFIKEVSKLNEASLPENISFHSKFCHEELVVKGDATQLQQVLMNLTNNARDAVAGVQEPMISLSIEPFEPDESFTNSHPDLYGSLFAHLVVRDNGSGISSTDQEHIFEPFFTTKEVGQGTGLGLAMAQGVIQSHGGVFEVESSPGEGSSFHVYLPTIGEEKASIVPEELPEIISGNRELILIVDDNADIRRTSKEVLDNMGYQVLVASDGLDAIEQYTANQHAVSLIIMDIVMPRMGGVQAAERIKNLFPDAKVIFVTGYDKDETLKREMPSDEYVILSKPYNITQLSRIIRDQLDS